MSDLQNKSYPRLEEVILVYENIGKGTEQDPFRLVLKVYTKDGRLLAENDVFKEIK